MSSEEMRFYLDFLLGIAFESDDRGYARGVLAFARQLDVVTPGEFSFLRKSISVLS